MKTKTDDVKELLQQIEVVVERVRNDKSLQKPDLRRLLRFINKVILVVDQAFQDVLVTFEDLKDISDDDIDRGMLEDLSQDIQLLLSRDRYRDVEYICGRLSTLKDIYNQQIRPLVERNTNDNDQWRQIFWLIEDREGRVIMLVQGLVQEILSDIHEFKQNRLPLNELQRQSEKSYGTLKKSIEELHQLNNSIMGFSGPAGLMELTDIGDDKETTTITMKPKNNPWISGSFYLVAAVVVLSLLMAAAKIVPLIIFPVVLIGGIIVFSIIGAFQLRNDERLSDKSFLELMALSFKQIPFVAKKK